MFMSEDRIFCNVGSWSCIFRYIMSGSKLDFQIDNFTLEFLTKSKHSSLCWYIFLETDTYIERATSYKGFVSLRQNYRRYASDIET